MTIQTPQHDQRTDWTIRTAVQTTRGTATLALCTPCATEGLRHRTGARAFETEVEPPLFSTLKASNFAEGTTSTQAFYKPLRRDTVLYCLIRERYL